MMCVQPVWRTQALRPTLSTAGMHPKAQCWTAEGDSLWQRSAPAVRADDCVQRVRRVPPPRRQVLGDDPQRVAPQVVAREVRQSAADRRAAHVVDDRAGHVAAAEAGQLRAQVPVERWAASGAGAERTARAGRGSSEAAIGPMRTAWPPQPSLATLLATTLRPLSRRCGGTSRRHLTSTSLAISGTG